MLEYYNLWNLCSVCRVYICLLICVCIFWFTLVVCWNCVCGVFSLCFLTTWIFRATMYFVGGYFSIFLFSICKGGVCIARIWHSAVCACCFWWMLYLVCTLYVLGLAAFGWNKVHTKMSVNTRILCKCNKKTDFS